MAEQIMQAGSIGSVIIDCGYNIDEAVDNGADVAGSLIKKMALPDSDYNDALLNATGQRNWLFWGWCCRSRSIACSAFIFIKRVSRQRTWLWLQEVSRPCSK